MKLLSSAKKHNKDIIFVSVSAVCLLFSIYSHLAVCVCVCVNLLWLENTQDLVFVSDHVSSAQADAATGRPHARSATHESRPPPILGS